MLRKGLNEPRRGADSPDMGLELTRELRARVERVVDRLRPALVADGGNVEILHVDEEGVVTIRFQGACVDCPAQAATLRLGLEASLRREVPEVAAVVPVAPASALAR